MLDGTEYFDCACGSPEHTIRFTLDLDDPPSIYCDFYLDQYIPWYKRIWVAIKYILKLPPQNAHFDNWIMRLEDTERLIQLLEKVKNV